MTVLTKLSTLFKFMPYKQEPLNNEENTVVYFEDEEKVEISPPPVPGRKLAVAFVQAITVMGFLGLLVLLIYFQYFQIANMHRYRGFCSIPIPVDTRELMDAKYRLEPLRWSSSPDVQVFSSLEAGVNDDVASFLREHLDIGDMLEKITVYDNDRQINFVHDFNENMTGIADVDRCFVLDLQRDWAPTPEELVLRIERGEPLDMSMVRGAWRVVLPPPHVTLPSAWGPSLCRARPVYLLAREPSTIRKRSTTEPAQEYLQFSGNHIAVIAISNIAEVENYEGKNKNN